MKNAHTSLFSLLFYSAYSFAQSQNAMPLPQPKTTNSAIRNMELADSFSKNGDSALASKYFLEIDPYFLISCNTTIETLDSEFANYNLTKNAQSDYRKIFTKVYYPERTQAFTTFRAMLQEDQDVRKKLSRCSDSLCRSVLNERMALTDSIHFEYLYAYVSKNGWPTYQNGGMYAEIIGMHDGKNMSYYLPHIQKSVTNGQSPMRFYSNILNRAKPSTLKKLKEHKNKVPFDISYILNGKEAIEKQIKEIQKAAVDHQPIKHIYFIYESEDKKDFTDFMKSAGEGGNKNYWLAWDILVHIERALKDTAHTVNSLPYDFIYSDIEGKQKKLTVYLAY